MKKVVKLSVREADAPFTDMPVYTTYALCLILDDLTVGDIKIGGGMGSSYYADKEFEKNYTIVEAPDNLEELLEQAEELRKEKLRVRYLAESVELNEEYVLIPSVGDKIEVIRGRKHKGKFGKVQMLRDDFYVNGSNYTNDSGGASNWRTQGILQIVNQSRNSFMGSRLRDILDKNLQCVDEEGNRFWVKPKYVKILNPTPKNEAEIMEWVEKRVENSAHMNKMMSKLGER